MADTSQSWGKEHHSAVIDLSDTEMEVAGSDTSDYETNFSDSKTGKEPTGSKKSEGGYMDSMKQRLQENVTNMMWQSGKEKAKSAWNVYGNIDFLRPYFNVEPHEVRTRLLFSLIPKRPTDERQKIPRELYGPMMVIFTLIALLLFQMKTAEHKVEEGTLMGTAFGVCFTYWFGASGFVWFLAYVCNARLALIQILSMMGYGLFSHCIVLFLGTVIHTSHDHVFFYLLWAVVGGLSALKMVSIVLSRTHGQRQRLIVCGAIAALHLLFLLYLHFAYHQIVEGKTRLLKGFLAQRSKQEVTKVVPLYLSQVFESHHPVPVEQKEIPEIQPADNKEFLCENSGVMTISCAEKPGTHLDIVFANYGRTSTDICKHPTLPSSFTGCTQKLAHSLSLVRGLCQEKTSCQLRPENSVFGDPCLGTYKYLEVQYSCKTSEVVDIVADSAKNVVDKAAPVVDTIVKSVNKTVGGVGKPLINQGGPGPLLNAIKDAAEMDNVKPA